MSFDLNLGALTGEARAAVERVKLGRPVVIFEGSWPVAVILPYPAQAVTKIEKPPPPAFLAALASAPPEGAAAEEVSVV